MRHSESDLPPIEDLATVEEKLRRENEELRRQLQALRGTPHTSTHVPANLWHPSRLTVVALLLVGLTLLIMAFVAGYVPLHGRQITIVNEAHERERALPRVGVIVVTASSRDSGLQLPGNIQAITEAPVLARADGYLKERLVDIGDRVQAGQTLAIIEAPELDEQVRQAEANLAQARAAEGQAEANLEQGQSDLELSRVTAKRYANLVGNGSVSVQENDQYQAEYRSRLAALKALQQALTVRRGAVTAAQADLARLENIRQYRVVTAPFTGIITLRNVDSGALVNHGSTMLFRIAQAGTLRIYVNVPQSHADSVHAGDAAAITVSNLPNQQFSGSVARTADALDPVSRTLLVDVRVPNPRGTLMPGMYAQVKLSSSRQNPPLLIPSTALIVSSDGTRVAIVGTNKRVHLQSIVAGRDYGDQIEIMSGLQRGDSVIASPSDVMREGAEVEPLPIPAGPTAQ
jgi:RND family efflux transporter MFP subunit